MPTKKHTVTCNQIKQLIDLNGDSVNFELSFRAVSSGNAPFDVLVVDQETLDSNPDLPYKNADTGTISGSIVSDKNVHQNYFLILKSDKPCQVTCDINIKEIPPAPPLHAPQTITKNDGYANNPMPSGPPKAMRGSDHGKPLIASLPGLKPWMLLVGAIVAAGILYMVYMQKPASSGSTSGSNSGSAAPPPVTYAPAPPRASSHSSLLARLNSLPSE
jgi:hypothetical protein